MAPELLCFSAASTLGGVDAVPLIQIKQIPTGVRTVRTTKPANQPGSVWGENVERADSSDGSASSALLPRPGERDRCADGGDGNLPGRHRALGGYALLAFAQPARTDGAQIREAAVRDRGHPRPAVAVHPYTFVLGGRIAPGFDRHSRFWHAAAQHCGIG